MKSILLPVAALLIASAAFADEPAKPVITGHILRFDSACDFTESNVRIQRDAILVEASLKSDAAARMKQASRDFLGQPVVIVINNVPISAPVMAGQVSVDKARFSVARDAAAKLLPSLLETTCHQVQPQAK
ncbi:hypothetical protein JFK97_04035 [Chromobacterium phragmitis]|uniref:hypothetical protein n=1 Tax=Chromobacterium amazonense TaxID=1382803 RepID=UPI0021B83B14|nr:hypothetical protein [Chromobacterium amazonense]MBM2883549.1 hypothetical protein [Chromobacterium amazonense]MDE1712318.1 hypothetical protein [Chromobacterium amazonense]